jgi:hypothetical protein
LYWRIVARSQPAIAGIYSQLSRRIAGSPVVFPNPAILFEHRHIYHADCRTGSRRAAASAPGPVALRLMLNI